MITISENFFHLQTKDTSYIFSISDSGLLVHNYYGPKIKTKDYQTVTAKLDGGMGTAILYENHPNEFIDGMDLEFSSIGIGDFRESMISLFHQDTGFYSNFKYQGFEIKEGTYPKPLPSSYDENQVLRVDLCDEILEVKVELYYKIFEKANIISKYIRLINNSSRTYSLRRLFSGQIDFRDTGYFMMTFDGAWAKERQLSEKKITTGIYINDSKTGSSSSKHNPLVILRKENTDEDQGLCYGFNLVYSGNHKTTIEVTPNQKMRVLMGINDHAFDYLINPNDEFITPEQVITTSSQGLNHLSQNFHYFVNHHIVRGLYKNLERPLLINSWEANYFNFDEKKLLGLAKKAKEVGIELFVLDDGWFGKRNNDRSSLGDWEVNLKKLPSGLKGLSEKINEIGLDFGLWVEPEMINEDSNLYREHPDWAVQIKGRQPGVSRNQLVLDLTNKEVREYLIEKLSEVFRSCNLKYVKWDYNRNISDMYGSTLINQGEFFHRYILGFYEIMEELTTRFPEILFEGCASGGNRFDLGILCYFPQIWTSDDTDYLERIAIQTGTSYGYPLSAITNHISAVPNHQTLRITPLTSRFTLSCFGNMGYELNLNDLTNQELREIKKQIQLYKQYRRLFQYGLFYRNNHKINHASYFYVIDNNQENAILGYFQELVHPALPEDIIYMDGLKNEYYRFKNLKWKINLKIFGGLINMVSPVKLKLNGKLHNFICRIYQPKIENEKYIINGRALKYSGVRLSQQFLGTGYNRNVRVLGDFGTRMYILKIMKDENI